MKYLKEFNTESDYTAYRSGDNYFRPNVSLCDENEMLYYNLPPPPITYEAVDLGLPTGTKWATQNVGARKPSDVGLYFQWGDTQGYTASQVGKDKQFDWSDYKWYLSGSTNDDSIKFKKYATTGAILELEDDAAHVNMGGSWHMPSPDQINELFDNTTTGETYVDSVYGATFTSKKDTSKSIFIPVAGFASKGSVSITPFANIWSSILDSYFVYYGNVLESDFYGYNFGVGTGERDLGYPVRGVIDG